MELVTLLSATSGSQTDRIPKWVVKKSFKNREFTKLSTWCKEAGNGGCGDLGLATGVGVTPSLEKQREQTPEPRKDGCMERGDVTLGRGS